jgi:hypothetical protein
MPAYNDFTVPYGAQVVTIYPGNQAFVAESLTITDASTQIERYTELGIPSSQVILPAFSKGTGTFQLATSQTSVPTIGATFTLTRNGTPPATVGCVVTDVGEVENQKDARKVTCGFRVRVAS